MKKQALFIVLMLMPLMASAQTKINGIYYWLNSTNKVAEVTIVPSGTTKYSGSITIPKAVTYGGETYSVTSIGDFAFNDCSGLTSVTIPNSVTSIGNSAFSGCSGLTSVTIPNGVTSIQGDTFYGCSSLTSVTIPNSVTFIDSYAFSGCSGLTSVTIPNSVTSIGWYAFSGCSGLTSLTIPNSVGSILEEAFSGCSGLTSITVENGNAVYDSRNNCNAIVKTSTNELIIGCKSTIIPNSVTSIVWFAFSGCSGLTSITIPNSVTSIGISAFSGCSGLTSVTIPNSVTSIGHSAFYGCSSLTSVTIPNGVTLIEDATFRECSSLTSVTIPNSVTSIGWSAFSGCSGLTSVTIPNSVTSIGESAFSGCTSLPVINNCRYADTYLVEVVDKTIASCTIKEGTRFIGYPAFSGCSWLTSITIPNSVTSIGQRAFSGCKNLISVNITDVAAWCQLNGGNQLLSPICHLVINGLEMKNIKNLVIPDGVTSIQPGAFKYSAGLTSVTIGNDVTSIGNEAFYECSDITSVTIGSNINSVGSKAFANCPEIKEVYCYAKDVPTISNDTFENSYYIKFATLYVPESSVDLYKASAWSQFGNIVGITGGNEGERCEKPVITLLANGKIKVESATEGATCVTNITASNAEPLSDGEISLNTPLIVYTVTSYATKEGYNDSEVATATFRYEKAEGDMNGDGLLNITDVIHLVNMILGQ